MQTVIKLRICKTSAQRLAVNRACISAPYSQPIQTMNLSRTSQFSPKNNLNILNKPRSVYISIFLYFRDCKLLEQKVESARNAVMGTENAVMGTENAVMGTTGSY